MQISDRTVHVELYHKSIGPSTQRTKTRGKRRGRKNK